MMYADAATNCEPLRSPAASPPIRISSGDLQNPTDRWTSAFLSYGSPSAPPVRPVYPPSARLLSLDALRHLPSSLPRLSHARVAHPTTRQPAFTVHHGAHSDLTAAGRSRQLVWELFHDLLNFYAHIYHCVPCPCSPMVKPLGRHVQ